MRTLLRQAATQLWTQKGNQGELFRTPPNDGLYGIIYQVLLKRWVPLSAVQRSGTISVC